jgi:hypothetical protein
MDAPFLVLLLGLDVAASVAMAAWLGWSSSAPSGGD